MHQLLLCSIFKIEPTLIHNMALFVSVERVRAP